MAGAFSYAGTTLTLPLLTGEAVNDLVYRRRGLTPVLLGIVGLGLARAATGALRKYAGTSWMAGLGADLRARLFSHLVRLSPQAHARIGVGQLLARYSSDVTAVEEAAALVPGLVQAVAMGVGGAVLLINLAPALGVAVIAVSIACAGAVIARGARPLAPSARGMQEATGAFAGAVEQFVAGAMVLKAHGADEVQVRRAARSAERIHDAGVGLARGYARFFALLVATPAIATALVLALGGWWGAHGQLSPGTLFAFVGYLGVLLTPIFVLAQLLLAGPVAIASLGRIGEVLTHTPDVADPPRPVGLPSGGGRIVFRGVVAGYAPGHAVLPGLDLEVPAGKAVALVGASGAGKTTAALLVPRFLDPWAGSVELDGVRVDRLALATLRAVVAVAFEDPVVFAGTIADNIRYGRLDATTEELHRAAEHASIATFIESLPNDYDTIVGDGGLALSGGQRQRLALARAVLREPRVLVLDDVTGALDPRTDAAVRVGLAQVMAGRTTLLIAHRWETVVLAEDVVLLDRGRVRARGSHDELAKLPAYRAALGLPESLVVGS